MKKLFRVSIDFDLLVLAQDSNAAEETARYLLVHSECDGEIREASIIAVEATKLRSGEDGVFPWTENEDDNPDELTCGQIVETIEASKPDPNQCALPGVE